MLTGCTGFLGKIILEKLLRTCPDVNKIYVMVRPKRGIEPMQRVKSQILNSVCFSFLTKQFPSRDAFIEFAEKKIVPVQGDLIREGLGLSKEDRLKLTQDVNVIINSAASVNFDDPL